MDRDMLRELQNADVFSTSGDKIGSVGQVYLDDRTEEPTFITVKTGLFGAKETFVPLDRAQTAQGGITLPYEKDFVKDAPNVDADGTLTPEEERRIYEYYSMDYDGGRDRDGMGDRRHDERDGLADRDRDGRRDERSQTDLDRDYEREARRQDDRGADRDRLGDVDGGAQDRSVRDQDGRNGQGLRLRREVYATTETVQVPVKHERVVMEDENGNVVQERMDDVEGGAQDGFGDADGTRR